MNWCHKLWDGQISSVSIAVAFPGVEPGVRVMTSEDLHNIGMSDDMFQAIVLDGRTALLQECADFVAWAAKRPPIQKFDAVICFDYQS